MAREALPRLVGRVTKDPFLLLLDRMAVGAEFPAFPCQETVRALAVGVVAPAAVPPHEDPVLVRLLEFLLRLFVAIHAESHLRVLEESRKGGGMIPVAVHAVAVPDGRVGRLRRFPLSVAFAAEVVGRNRRLPPGMTGRTIPVQDRLVNGLEKKVLGTGGMWVMAVEASRGRGDDTAMDLPHTRRAGVVATVAQLLGLAPEQTGHLGTVGDMAPVATLLGRPVEFLVLHLLRHGLVADQTELPLVPFQEIGGCGGMGIVACPAIPHGHRRVNHTGGQFLSRFLMAVKTKPGGLVFQYQFVAESVAIVAFLTIPLAERRMGNRLRLLGVVPLAVTFHAGFRRYSPYGQEYPGKQQAIQGETPSRYDRYTSPVHAFSFIGEESSRLNT
jgi:hypothetical protein